MKINCLACGHMLDLQDSYDDYQGQIRCFICGALMTIRTQDSQVRSAELGVGRQRAAEASLERVP